MHTCTFAMQLEHRSLLLNLISHPMHLALGKRGWALGANMQDMRTLLIKQTFCMGSRRSSTALWPLPCRPLPYPVLHSQREAGNKSGRSRHAKGWVLFLPPTDTRLSDTPSETSPLVGQQQLSGEISLLTQDAFKVEMPRAEPSRYNAYASQVAPQRPDLRGPDSKPLHSPKAVGKLLRLRAHLNIPALAQNPDSTPS